MTINSISPSKLQLYADCPRCFLLATQKRFQMTTEAMRFGTRLHKSIELYHKEGAVSFASDIQPYLDEYMREYTEDFNCAEEFWKVDLFDTGVILNLKIDLIKDDILTEHKTSKRPYSQEHVDTHRQITAYSWAWRQLYDEPENDIKVNVFITDPKPGDNLLQVLTTNRREDQFLEWREWVTGIIEDIRNDQFEPRAARWHNYEECPLYKERL